MSQSIARMRIACRPAILCALVGCLPAVAGAQAINGINLQTRVFNDFTTSTLATTNTNANPGTVTITESNYTNDGVGGNFANRHDAMFSTDHGATTASFDIRKGFTQSMIINLADGSNSPRKEAGFRIKSPVTGDALFIVNSDAGEIVAFGAGAPFFKFGDNASGGGYTPGTPLFMAETYTPAATPGGQGTVQYYINRTAANGFGAGVVTSGPLAYSNLEGGPVNYSIGAYVQVAPNLTATPPDFLNASFTNLTAAVTPEPTTLAALSLVGAALGRRRRA